MPVRFDGAPMNTGPICARCGMSFGTAYYVPVENPEPHVELVCADCFRASLPHSKNDHRAAALPLASQSRPLGQGGV